MKTITQMILGILLVSFNYSNAQPQANSENTDSGYKYEEVRYYYFPNMEAYYDAKVGMYLYVEDGEWIESEVLEPKSRGYSLKNGAYVMIKDYLGDEPYAMLREHKRLYPADYSSRPKRPTPNAQPTVIHHTNTLASN